MTGICQITGKKLMKGNKRSHAMNATKRKFLPNIKYRKFWITTEKRYIKLKVSTKGMRIIDKKGIESFLRKNK